MQRSALVAFTALALAVTGCGSDDEPADLSTWGAVSESVATATSPATSPASSPTSTALETPPAPLFEAAELTGRDTVIALDPGFLQALTSLGLSPSAVGDATIEDGALVLPITGGDVTVLEPGTGGPTVDGMVDHRGAGLSLSADGTSVALSSLTVLLGRSSIHAEIGIQGREPTRAALFRLDLGTVQTPVVEGRTMVLDGGRVTLDQTGAIVLNQVFATEAFQDGLLIGVARITVDAP